MTLDDLFERSINNISQQDIEQFRNMQQRTDIKSIDIRPEKVDRVLNVIKKKIYNGKIKIFRAIELEPMSDLNISLKRRLGTSWTYEVGSARPYQSKHGGYGDEYVIETTIPEKYIDWDATIALNTIKTRGSYEEEIKLFKNTPITIDKIYLSAYGKLIEEDISKLTGTFIS